MAQQQSCTLQCSQMISLSLILLVRCLVLGLHTCSCYRSGCSYLLFTVIFNISSLQLQSLHCWQLFVTKHSSIIIAEVRHLSIYKREQEQQNRRNSKTDQKRAVPGEMKIHCGVETKLVWQNNKPKEPGCSLCRKSCQLTVGSLLRATAVCISIMDSVE